MAAEFWILLIILASAIAAAAGFTFARRGAPSQLEIDALHQELETARKQATEVQDNVTGHFEQSALLFGRLAHDYRAFLEHFSESAKDLGIDEVSARELLERADLPLLGDNRGVIEAEAGPPDIPAAVADEAAQSDGPTDVEPPLIEDVVESEGVVGVESSADVSVPDSPLPADETLENVSSTVVDVELDPLVADESVKQARSGL